MRKLTKLIISLLFLVLLAAALKSVCDGIIDRFFPLRYASTVEKYADKNGLDKYLVMGLICAESGYDSQANSGVASGLMQITDDTARWIAEKMGKDYYKEMVNEPEANIEMGCFYLSYLIGKYKNTDTALAAYNAGLGKVSAWLKDPKYSKDGENLYNIPYEETRNYVKRVNLYSKIYRKIYSEKIWR